MFTHKLTDDTELRLLDMRHAEEIYALVDRNREHLRRWLPWVDDTKSVYDIQAFIRSTLFKLAENGSITTGIWHNETLAGVIGLNFVNGSCRQIGYWLSEDRQGKGLITTACKALINHAFNQKEVKRIEIKANSANVRSRAVPERLGFTHEGTLRQAMMATDGKLADHVVYSLLKDEWEERRGQF